MSVLLALATLGILLIVAPATVVGQAAAPPLRLLLASIVMGSILCALALAVSIMEALLWPTT
jgi:hypothetical protein